MAEIDTATPTVNNGTDINTPGQVSYSDFAKKIRAKYPNSKLYAGKPDKELVDAWIQAKPERSVYTNKIKGFDPLNEGLDKGKVPSQLPVSRAGGKSGGGTQLEDTSKIKKRSLALEEVGSSLPAIGGVVGGIIGKTPGAALGGGLMAGVQDIYKRMVLGIDKPDQQVALHMLGEAAKQGALEKVGQKAGDAFFYLLGKIPHAAIIKGIPLLPSDLHGGRVTKYIEDLLTNLIPSSGTMAAFKESQNKAAIGSADKLAKGFSRFRGTSEEFGILIQDTYRSFEKQTRQDLARQAKTLTRPKDIFKTAEYKAYEETFKNELASKIAKTNKPELIAGFIRGTSGLHDTRTMMQYLSKESPKVMNAAKTRIMMDVIQETLTGSKDPILKNLQKQDTQFAGEKFKKVLDGIGEEKLKAIYGDTSLQAIKDFSELIKRVGGGSGSGAGKFLNLLFLLGPLRSGMTLATGKKLAIEGFVFNRAAKIITSTQGVKLYENYIRAVSMGGVKTVSAARDALKTYSEHADAEYMEEQKAVEDEYYKNHPDEVKYRNLNK